MASSRSSVLSAALPRKGSTEPRIFTPPLRKLTRKTTLGFAFIEFCTEVVGTSLLPWQEWLALHALELLPDGTFRFRTVVLLVARQNGKSTFLQLLALFFMYVRGAALVIGTAQNLDIAEEVWQGAVDIAQDVPELAAEIQRVNMTNGKKSLELSSGERYKVQAANRRGGRGLSGDLVLMDELREHQSWDAWGAVTKTTLARQYAQIWAASNAGDAASIVLRHLRKMAHDALGDPDGLNQGAEDEAPPDDELDVDVDDLGIFEWSAAPGASLDDPEGRAQANPSQGYTITERAILSARRTDPEWVYRTECLCQWSDGSLVGPFPPGTWDAGREERSGLTADAAVTLCVAVSWERAYSHIALSGRRADGDMWVELVASRVGTHWLTEWLTSPDRQERVRTAPVVVQANGAPESSLVEEFREAGVDVVEWKGSDLTAATGAFYDAVRDGTLKHGAWPALDIAAATAVPRMLEGGAFLWDRRRSPNDAAPLHAATGATWFARTREPDYDLLESVF